jgi:hypothetical protein
VERPLLLDDLLSVLEPRPLLSERFAEEAGLFPEEAVLPVEALRVGSDA